MKAYQCNHCKNFFSGSPHRIIGLITDLAMGKIGNNLYDLCSSCSVELSKWLNTPDIRRDREA